MSGRKTRIIDVDEVEWVDGSALTALPAGVRMKVFQEGTDEGITDALVHFPPGYVEPRHTHGIWHSCFLIEGRWIVEGKELAPGSYMHGPSGADQPHGPFESPDGCLVYVSSGGTDQRHDWDPAAPLDTQAQGPAAADNRTRIVHVDELEWKEGSTQLTLPAGVRIKVFVEDAAAGRTDALIHFPPGYVEPRHTHAASHSGALLEGRWIVEGKELHRGGYFYGPAGEEEPHGPFESPEGTLVFVSFRGTGEAMSHKWSE